MTTDEIAASVQRQKARLIDAIANLCHAALEAASRGDGYTGVPIGEAIEKAEAALKRTSP